MQLRSAYRIISLLASAGTSLGANVRSNRYACPWQASGQISEPRLRPKPFGGCAGLHQNSSTMGANVGTLSRSNLFFV